MGKKYKVVLTDHVYPDLDYEKEMLASVDAELCYLNSLDEKEISDAVVDADALITCYANISANVIKNMTKCRSITKTGIGVNNIDVAQATAQGIHVMNVPDYCIEEVSDHTVALILCTVRQVVKLSHNVAGGNWSMQGASVIRRIKGKTLGLLGFGKIARRTAEKMQPFGMRILAYDPYITTEQMSALNVTKATLEDVLSQADVVSMNLPLTKETDKMANAMFFSRMKKDAFLVNTSRGGLVDEAALYEALVSGEIAGVALDVLNDEVNVASNPLPNCNNVVITPHSAFHSVESTQEMREKVIADVIAVLSEKAPRYPINKI